MSTLDREKRTALRRGIFEFPDQRKEPPRDVSHVRNAIARFGQVEGVTRSERAEARKHILAAAEKSGVEVGAMGRP